MNNLCLNSLGKRFGIIVLLTLTGCAGMRTVRGPGPQVLWSYPTDFVLSASVQNSFSLTPRINSERPVTTVAFVIDGRPRATLHQAPWTYAWPLTNESTGTHRVEVRATDTAGRTGKGVATIGVAHTRLELLNPLPGTEFESGTKIQVYWRTTAAPQGARVNLVRLICPKRDSIDLVPAESMQPLEGFIDAVLPADLETSDDYQLSVSVTVGPTGTQSLLASQWLQLSINRSREKTPIQERRWTYIKALKTQDARELHRAINALATLGPHARKAMFHLTPFLEDDRMVPYGTLMEPLGQATARALRQIDPTWVAPPGRVDRLVARAQQPFKVQGSSQHLVDCTDQAAALRELTALGRSAMVAIPQVTSLAGRSCTLQEATNFFDAAGDPEPETVNNLIGQLRDPDPSVREGVILYFQRHPAFAGPAIPSLRSLSKDPELRVRLRALTFLAQNGRLGNLRKEIEAMAANASYGEYQTAAKNLLDSLPAEK